MKKTIAFVLLSISLSGCAQLNATRAWLSDPQTIAAAGTLRSGAIAFACAVANAAAISGQIEVAVNAGTALQGNNVKVYTISSSVCSALGGRVVGTAKVR